MRMDFKNKIQGTSKTNKTFNHCDLERDFKTNHTACPIPKHLTRMKAYCNKKLCMNPEFSQKLTLNLKTKRESLLLKVFER